MSHYKRIFGAAALAAIAITGVMLWLRAPAPTEPAPSSTVGAAPRRVLVDAVPPEAVWADGGVDGRRAEEPRSGGLLQPVGTPTREDCEDAFATHGEWASAFLASKERDKWHAALDELDAEWQLDDETRDEVLTIIDDGESERASLTAASAKLLDAVASAQGTDAALRGVLGDARADELRAAKAAVDKLPASAVPSYTDTFDQGWAPDRVSEVLKIMGHPACDAPRRERAERAAERADAVSRLFKSMDRAGSLLAADLVAEGLELDEERHEQLRAMMERHVDESAEMTERNFAENYARGDVYLEEREELKTRHFGEVQAFLGEEGGDYFRKVAYAPDELDEEERARVQAAAIEVVQGYAAEMLESL